VLSFESELEALRAGAAIDDQTAAPLIAVERRDVFSIAGELRAITWIGVMLIVTGAGIVVSKHIDDIGPITLAVVIGAVSAGCYGWAWWRRRQPSLVDEYLLLLASLLLSTDVGYVEHQFHLFGPAWPRHLLLLAIVHAVVAYLFDSRVVLSLSIGALAAWLGIERNLDAFDRATVEIGIRAFIASAIVLAWREVDRRVRPATHFSDVFAHFAANLAFWGALILTFHEETQIIGAIVTMAIGIAAAFYAFRTNSEAFLMYAYVYGVIAADRLVIELLGDEVLGMLYLVFSTIVAIVGFFITHNRFRKRVA
jgi:Predicted membrane protein (DUF2157)